MIIKLINFV